MIKVYIETYGCTLNQADSEIIAGILLKHGHKIVSSIEDADVIIVNTCTVKLPTEDKIVSRLEKLSRVFDSRRIIVAGCLPQAERFIVENRFPDMSMMGPYAIHKVHEIVEKVLKGKKVVYLPEDNRIVKACMPKVRRNPIVEIVPISAGCIGNCAYCIVKFARGKLFSYPPEKIFEQARKAVEEGVKELWLTSQDTGIYGWDRGYTLPQLVKKLTRIPGDFFMRIGMMTPNSAMKILDDLLDAYRSRKVFKFIHLPLQSGNDRVLSLMNRRYTVEDFVKLIERIREKFPRMNIMTDIIVGFPTETFEEFMDTVKLMKELKLDSINVSRYWPRPGTEASKLKRHSWGETKRRSRIMTKIGMEISLERNLSWKGWVGNVIVDEFGKPGTWMGRNYAYKQFVIPSNEYLFGSVVKVRAVGALPTAIIAKKIKVVKPPIKKELVKRVPIFSMQYVS